MSDSRRLKKITFDQEQLHGGVPAQDLLRQMADFLPPDAKLVGFDRDFSRAVLYMVFWSSTFEEADPGCYLPEATLTLKRDYVYAGPAPVAALPSKAPATCNCNADYTGLPHDKTCPLRRRQA